MVKKVKIIVLASVVFAAFSTTAFASSDNSTPSYRGYGQETITRDLTPAERKAALAKEFRVRQSNSTTYSINSIAAITSKRLGITAFTQEETNYCGPTAALNVLDYRWATPYQDDLASDWNPTAGTHGMNTITNNGTTTPDMVRTINYFAGISWYVSSTINSSSTLWTNLKNDLDLDYPANILVDTKHLSWYNGKSLNHFVTVYGYWTDGTNKKADIADPHYNSTYQGKHNDESFTNVFNAVNAQNWRANLAW